jgi:hypothetical protein
MTNPITHREAVEWIKAVRVSSAAHIRISPQDVIAWVDDAHDAMESASIQLEHVGGTYCSISACPRCAIKHDIHLLIGLEPNPWPKCTNCHEAIDEYAKYANQPLCTTCREDLSPRGHS